MALIWEILSSITMLLPLSAFWIIIFLFLNKSFQLNKTAPLQFLNCILSHSKIKFIFSYVLALFINLSAVAAMLPNMAKLSAILKSECVNILEFLLLLEKE